MDSKHVSAAAVLAVLGSPVLAGCDSQPFPRDRGAPPDGGPATAHDPIVFVHGWRGSAASWNTMTQRFVAAGWSSDQLFAISLSDPNSGAVGINITHAGEIENYIENTVLPRTGAKRVDLIAHSMGGLSAMYYVHALDGATRGTTADIVCLDCGVQGSTDPLILFAIPDFDQSSQAVEAVRDGDQTPAGILPDPEGKPHIPGDVTYTFYWHVDAINALAGGVSQQWPNTAHNEFLTDPDVFTAVKSAVMQHER